MSKEDEITEFLNALEKAQNRLTAMEKTVNRLREELREEYRKLLSKKNED